MKTALLIAIACFSIACSGPAFTVAEVQGQTAPPDAVGLPLDAFPVSLPDAGAATQPDAGPTSPPDAPPAQVDLDAGQVLPDAGVAQPEAAAALPTSCAALADGDYEMTLPSNVGVAVYAGHCSGGLTYLVLPHPERNFSSYAVGGLVTGTELTTTFSKLRFYPSLLQVDATDLTFATSVGTVLIGGAEGNTPQSSLPYGVAAACTSSATGTASIDLAGTGFSLVPGQLGPGGYGGVGSVDASPDGLTTTIVGGGIVVGMGPRSF